MNIISQHAIAPSHRNSLPKEKVTEWRNRLQLFALALIFSITGCKKNIEYNFVIIEAHSLGNGGIEFKLNDPKTDNKKAHLSYISGDSTQTGAFEVTEGTEKFYNQALVDTTGKIFYWKLSLYETGKDQNGQTWEAQVPETDTRQFHMNNQSFDQNQWVFPIEMD